MSNIRFVWDVEKAAGNLHKHRVSFDEAKTVFLDEDGLLQDDPDHSRSEERFILLGRSSYSNVIVVCHCYRENGEIVRIISARKATKREQQDYWRVR